MYISAFTLMSIAIDRYLIVIYPLKQRMSNRICFLIIVVIWVTGILLTLPYGTFMVLIQDTSLSESTLSTTNMSAIQLTTVQSAVAANLSAMQLSNVQSLTLLESSSKVYCDEAWPHDDSRRAYSIVTTVLQFFVPLVIIGYCYIKVCGKLKKRVKPGSKTPDKEKSDRERSKRTNRMLISMVAIFCVCWFPLNAHNLLIDFHNSASNWPYIR